MGVRRRKEATTAAAASLPAQGHRDQADPAVDLRPRAAGKDIYEPEKVVAQRIIKGGVSQYQVKWTGYESKHNTWEPLVFVMLVCA